MMHKIILQILKNHKSHGLLNSKFMDYTFDCHNLCGLWYGPLIDEVCVKDLKLVEHHNKEAKVNC
jgi:hypothetical protein